MIRVACARLRDAPLAAHVRCEPDLSAQAVAIVDTAGTRGRVVACTQHARLLGVSIGQTGPQASAVAPALVVRVADAGRMTSAYEALANAAEGVAARVEPDGPRVYIDLTGLGTLHGSDGGFVAALDHAVRSVGLDADIGVANGKVVARVAASRHVGGAIVPAGGERAFLAPLPLEVLSLSPALRVTLARLGVRCVGDLAALPLEATGLRLGARVAQAITLARGQDTSTVFPRPHATRFEESLALDWEVHDAQALAFVVKRLADALVQRLGCRALAAAAVTLSLSLVSQTLDERTLTLATPTRDAGTLVHLVRASLEGRPPPDAVVGVRLIALAAASRPVQLGLFDPPGPAPEAWMLTLARLTALVGEGRVGAPYAPDTHRPHAAAVVPFTPLHPHRHDTQSPAAPLALHVFRPPRPAEVLITGGQMASLQAGEIVGRVHASCGPFRVTGEWWGSRFDRDGYDVVLHDGGRYLIAFDRLAHAWTIEGRYE